MRTATEVFFDPTIYGHRLVEPIQWYGRHISQILTEPLPEGVCAAFVEVAVRIVVFVALVFLSPLLVVVAPSALAGWGIKYYSQPISPPVVTIESGATPTPAEPEAPPALVPPSTGLGPTVAESIQEAQRDSAVVPATSSPQASSFVPFTPEIVQEAQRKAEELKVLYGALKDLNSSDAQRLFSGVAEFRSQFEKHRNLDGFTIDDMTKIFSIVDEIAANTSGMHVALKHWFDFYRVQADDQGVIPQPKDGNCWLHTSILGLQHINHPNLGNDNYITLRGKVVEWMQAHYETDGTLRHFIADALEAHKTVEARRLQEEIDSLTVAIGADLIEPDELHQVQETLKNYGVALQNLGGFTLDDYFAHMTKLGSHGTHAELYAISRMFQVHVAIWREIPASQNLASRLTREYDEQIECPHAVHTVNAVLTQEGNHFNYRLPQSV